MLKQMNHRSLTFLLLILTLFFLAVPFGRHLVVAQQQDYKAGDIVEVKWIDKWVIAKVDKCLNASTCMVHFYDVSSGVYATSTDAISTDHMRATVNRPPTKPDTARQGNDEAATATTQNTTPQEQPEPSPAIGQLKYKVGDRVDYIYDGKWYKAIITKVRDDSADHLDGKIFAPYRVHPLGDNGNTDAWVCCVDFTDRRSQLRPAGSGPTEPVPGGEANDEVLKAMRAAKAATPTQPPAKQYHCVYFVVDHLVDAAPFTITGNSTYKDSDGKRGTYSFNSASATLTFHGGNYDGQRAEYETSGGKPQLHILGPSGRRVIDCD
jgi:hypothetical protein